MIPELTGQSLALFDFLSKKAKNSALSNYTEAGTLVGLEPHNPNLWKMLGEISEYTYKKYGVMLSVLVVNYNTGYPGGQFYDLVESLTGNKVKDRLKFFCEHYRKVHNTKW